MADLSTAELVTTIAAAIPDRGSCVRLDVTPIELLVLKKLAVINGALAKSLTGAAAREQTALLRVLIDVLNRAEVSNATVA